MIFVRKIFEYTKNVFVLSKALLGALRFFIANTIHIYTYLFITSLNV